MTTIGYDAVDIKGQNSLILLPMTTIGYIAVDTKSQKKHTFINFFLLIDTVADDNNCIAVDTKGQKKLHPLIKKKKLIILLMATTILEIC